MKRFFPVFSTLAFLSGGALAQETKPAPAPPNVAPPPTVPDQTTAPLILSPDQRSALNSALSVSRTESLWYKPLDWKEQDATLTETIAHIRASLGAKSPRIELRAKSSIRSTFTLPGALLGPTLSSIAELANLQVWVLPEVLLLSPETALSPQERAAIQQHKYGEWKRSLQAGMGYWDGNAELSKVALPIIGADIKARLGTKVPVPTPATNDGKQLEHWPYEIPFGELSAPCQQILQDMWDLRRENLPEESIALDVAPSITVCYKDDGAAQYLELRKYDPQKPGPNQIQGQWFVSRYR